MLQHRTQGVIPPPDGGYPGNNTAEGQNALLSLTAGIFNTAVGSLSLKSDVTGSGNTAIGAGNLFANTKEKIKPMDKASETLFLLNPVAFRYKKEIDPRGVSQFGLVAEDVEKVNPDLVVHHKEGKPYSVRYDQVNAMLLNEFLKEHHKGEEQDLAISQLVSTFARQQKTFESKLAQQGQQIAALKADLQSLAANVELNKAESRTVAEK